VVDWDSKLRETIPSPCFERPFVCDGFPSESTMIVIGENPATPLQFDWWNLWRANSGFDYQAFIDIYKKERSKLGKGISNTRRRLDRFRKKGVLCVETNAFRNEKLDGAGEGSPNFDVLNLLICHMPNLKGVLAHGKVAQKYLRLASIPKTVPRYETRHFRGESFSTIDAICAEIGNDT